MQTISAIPTTYRGTAYRSRLEARIAASFDRLGVPFDYEPEAFQIGDVQYLPDFYLSAARVWVEAKPTWQAIRADHKAQALAQADGNTPVFYTYPWKSHDDYKGPFEGRLVVMGARGATGSVSSAVWARCPGCNVLRPWNIGSRDYVACCNEWFEPEQWWDGHYGKDRKSDLPFGLRLPQYQDGRMVWAA